MGRLDWGLSGRRTKLRLKIMPIFQTMSVLFFFEVPQDRPAS